MKSLAQEMLPHFLSQDIHRQAVVALATFQRAAEMVARRWTPQIVRVLLVGPARYRDLRVAIPAISDNLLSERLKELEAEGIVERHVSDCGPVRVEYVLTAKGRALEPTVRALKSWAHNWLPRQ